MLDPEMIQLIITIVIAMVVFAVLWKVLKFALRTALVVALLIVGFYFAFGIIDLQIPEVSAFLQNIVNQFK